MAAPPEKAVRVLVVDDDPELRRLLTLALTDEGYDVRAAPDGRAALALLESWRPRVILLDLMMPVLDGWGFRARQLATSGAEEVPVIVLSAAREARTEALQPAAVVPKPFNLPHLLDTVAAVVLKGASRGPAERRDRRLQPGHGLLQRRQGRQE